MTVREILWHLMHDGYNRWPPIRFLPFLQISLFLAGLTLIAMDILHVPDNYAWDRHLGLVPGIWEGMLIGAPVLALVSAWLVTRGGIKNLVWGLGLRVAADIGAATVVVTYVTARLSVEHYVTSGAILIAVAVFSLTIVGRDIRSFARRNQ